MLDCAERQALRYSAFISYSHRDAAFARHLHRRLESYRLPRRLCRGGDGREGIARRLKPIFRDREELAAAPDLTSAVREAIGDASYLIIICSAHSRSSAWVAREVALFREIHGEGAVLAATVEGGAEKCLRAVLGDGGSAGPAFEPLAADFRREGDGSRLALLKLVAVLSGVRLDQLVQRDTQRRLRQVTTISVGAVLSMAAMGGLALVAVNARVAKQHEQERGQSLVAYSLTDLRARLKPYVPLDLLDAINKGPAEYYRSQDPSHLDSVAIEQRAKLLQAVGQDDESRGKLQEADAQFKEARGMTGSLLNAAPNVEDRIFAHSQSEYWVGELSWRLGRYSEAEKDFFAYETLTQQLVQIAPTKPASLMERGYAESNLGTFFLRRKIDLARSQPYYLRALGAFKAAEARSQDGSSIRREIADIYGWLGDVSRLRGDCIAARASREEARRILIAIQNRDEQNVEIRSALIANELALARTEICRGALQSAIDRLSKGRQAALELSHGDPDDADLRRQVRIFDMFRIRIWMMMPANLRPANSVMSNTLGDCNLERRLPNNEELATFCSILEVRRSANNGDTSGVQKWLSSLRATDRLQGDCLTERWGLNFVEEVRWATKI